MSAFLERCTAPVEPHADAKLQAYEATEFTPPGYDPRPVVDEVRACFGPGGRLEAGCRFPDTGDVEYRWEWHVPPERFEAALSVTERMPRWRASYFGPVRLCRRFEFGLRDPSTGSVLPHQEMGALLGLRTCSSVHLCLAIVPTATLDLFFPFAEPDHAFAEYFDALQAHMPVKVAHQRFRLLVPTRDGMGLRFAQGRSGGLRRGEWHISRTLHTERT